MNLKFAWILGITIACFQMPVSGQALMDIDLLDEIEMLKRKDEMNEQLIEELQSTVQEQSKHIVALEALFQYQSKYIELLTATSDEKATDNPLKEPSEPTSGTDVPLANDLDHTHQHKTTGQTGEARESENKRQTSEGPIAFHANVRTSDHMNIRIGQMIVFGEVQVNLGNGYQSNTGLFIAPRAGIYCFSTSITTTNFFEAYIEKNGHVIVGFLTFNGNHTNYQQATITSVVKLEAGEEVWVQNGGPDDATFHGNQFSSFSSFSGFLISQTRQQRNDRHISESKQKGNLIQTNESKQMENARPKNETKQNENVEQTNESKQNLMEQDRHMNESKQMQNVELTNESKQMENGWQTNKSKQMENVRQTYESKQMENARPKNESEQNENVELTNESKQTDNVRQTNESKQTDNVRQTNESKQTDNVRQTNESKQTDNVRQTNESKQKEHVRQTDEGPIAFHANVRTPDVMNIGIGQKIVFEEVQLNLGNGYDRVNGLFTAPRAGIYCFSTSITTTKYIEAYIMKNGHVVLGVLTFTSDNRYQQGSATTVVRLAAGDEVWVQNAGPSDATVHGNTFTSFSGFLVHPL